MYESTLKALAEYARATRNGMQYYARELHNANENAPDGQEAQALTTRIKQWVPDAALTEKQAVDFYVRYFSAFMSAYREHRRLKEDHKKFEGQYMKRDSRGAETVSGTPEMSERISGILQRMERTQRKYVRDDRRME